MKINIREDSVEIDGYVNAVERLSKPLNSRIGKFRERIKAGAFQRAIERNDDIHVLLNHDANRDLGSTKQGNLELHEDNIGLRAKATITDADVIAKAKHGDLVGWSFGFGDRDVDTRDVDGMMTRDVKDLDLYEVSILDRSKVPAYDGTLIQARDTNGDAVSLNTGEVMTDDKPEVTEEKPGEKPADETEEEASEKRDIPEEETSTIDYSKWDNLIAELKEE
nr:MAG TPA: head maturation protease [Caudoviricetes sp.]